MEDTILSLRGGAWLLRAVFGSVSLCEERGQQAWMRRLLWGASVRGCVPDLGRVGGQGKKIWIGEKILLGEGRKSYLHLDLFSRGLYLLGLPGCCTSNNPSNLACPKLNSTALPPTMLSPCLACFSLPSVFLLVPLLLPGGRRGAR